MGVVSFYAQPLYPQGKVLLEPTGWEDGWCPELVWKWWQKFHDPAGTQNLVAQPIAQSLYRLT